MARVIYPGITASQRFGVSMPNRTASMSPANIAQWISLADKVATSPSVGLIAGLAKKGFDKATAEPTAEEAAKKIVEEAQTKEVDQFVEGAIAQPAETIAPIVSPKIRVDRATAEGVREIVRRAPAQSRPWKPTEIAVVLQQMAKSGELPAGTSYTDFGNITNRVQRAVQERGGLNVPDLKLVISGQGMLAGPSVDPAVITTEADARASVGSRAASGQQLISALRFMGDGERQAYFKYAKQFDRDADPTAAFTQVAADIAAARFAPTTAEGESIWFGAEVEQDDPAIVKALVKRAESKGVSQAQNIIDQAIANAQKQQLQAAAPQLQVMPASPGTAGISTRAAAGLGAPTQEAIDASRTQQLQRVPIDVPQSAVAQPLTTSPTLPAPTGAPTAKPITPLAINDAVAAASSAVDAATTPQEKASAEAVLFEALAVEKRAGLARLEVLKAKASEASLNDFELQEFYRLSTTLEGADASEAGVGASGPSPGVPRSPRGAGGGVVDTTDTSPTEVTSRTPQSTQQTVKDYASFSNRDLKRKDARRVATSYDRLKRMSASRFTRAKSAAESALEKRPNSVVARRNNWLVKRVEQEREYPTKLVAKMPAGTRAENNNKLKARDPTFYSKWKAPKSDIAASKQAQTFVKGVEQVFGPYEKRHSERVTKLVADTLRASGVSPDPKSAAELIKLAVAADTPQKKQDLMDVVAVSIPQAEPKTLLDVFGLGREAEHAKNTIAWTKAVMSFAPDPNALEAQEDRRLNREYKRKRIADFADRQADREAKQDVAIDREARLSKARKYKRRSRGKGAAAQRAAKRAFIKSEIAPINSDITLTKSSINRHGASIIRAEKDSNATIPKITVGKYDDDYATQATAKKKAEAKKSSAAGDLKRLKANRGTLKDSLVKLYKDRKDAAKTASDDYGK